MKISHTLSQSLSLLLLCITLTAQAQGLPEPQKWQEGNTRVFFIPTDNIPIVDIRLAFDAGSARDGKQHGLSSITAELLKHGTGALQEEAFKDQLDFLGSQLNILSSKDMATISLRSLAKKDILDQSIGQLSDLLKSPYFPQAGFERILKARITELDAAESYPSHQINKALWQVLYPSHPYEHNPKGTQQSLNALQLSDIKRFYQQHYTADNAVLAIIGDLNKQQAQQIAKRIISSLPQGKRMPAIAQPTTLKLMQHHIPFQSQQTHIRLAGHGVSRKTPIQEYVALYMANYILGGNGLVSELALSVREQAGLAYSIYSYFRPMASTGPFVIGLQTQQPEQAIKRINLVLQKFMQALDDKAITETRTSIVGGFILSVDSNHEMLNYITMMAFYDLPTTYLNDFTHTVKTLPPEYIRKQFKSFLNRPRALISVGPKPS